MTVQHELSAQARNFNWLLTSFVDGTSGVTLAVAVSSDGLLMAMSNSIDRATAEQLSAIIAGMASLGHSTARCFGLGAALACSPAAGATSEVSVTKSVCSSSAPVRC